VPVWAGSVRYVAVMLTPGARTVICRATGFCTDDGADPALAGSVRID
jgi:hypothetical protein